MTAGERTLNFECGGERLAGVLSLPEPAGATPVQTAVVIVVGGPQYRAGSHRQFVLLARVLAAAGWPALRFDVRGMGDSSGQPRPFDALDEDVQAAVDATFSALPGLQQVVLWGLCDGASAALLYAGRKKDPRIAGLCLLNPWVRSEASLARTHVKHYYAARLRQPDFWTKLLRGGVALKAARDLARNLAGAWSGSRPPPAGRPLDFRGEMAAAWAAYRGALLLLLSGDDYTAREFVEVTAADPAWTGCMARSSLRRVEIAAADHTFSDAGCRVEMETAVLDWLLSQFDNARLPAVAQPDVRGS